MTALAANAGNPGDLLRQCRLGNVDEVKAMIQAGAQAPSGGEPLGLAWIHAAKGDVLEGSGSRNNIGVLELLRPKVKNVNLKGPDGETAVMAATGNGQSNTLKWLLKNGGDPNLQDPSGRTALHYVPALFALPSCKESILALKASKANASVKDKKGNTPLANLQAVEERLKKKPSQEDELTQTMMAITKECIALLK